MKHVWRPPSNACVNLGRAIPARVHVHVHIGIPHLVRIGVTLLTLPRTSTVRSESERGQACADADIDGKGECRGERGVCAAHAVVTGVVCREGAVSRNPKHAPRKGTRCP